MCLYPWKTVAPRTAFLPRVLSCRKGESAGAHDNICTASLRGRCFLHGRGGFGTQRNLFCPVAGSGGTSRKEAPLSEDKLLRKEDLGLTLTETGSSGIRMDRSGRKDLPGRGKAVVETSLCFLSREDEEG